MREIIIKSILTILLGTVAGILIYMLFANLGQNIPTDAIKI